MNFTLFHWSNFQYFFNPEYEETPTLILFRSIIQNLRDDITFLNDLHYGDAFAFPEYKQALTLI